jgi:small conductance mechanosensitive channel
MDIINSLFTSLNNLIQRYLINIVFALIVVLIGFGIARFVKKLIFHLLNEINFAGLIFNGNKKPKNLNRKVANITEYIIYFFVIVIALNQLGVTSIILYLITAAVLILIILFIAFSIKDFIPNFFAGLSIKHKQMIKKGDFIEFKDSVGVVDEINLSEIKVRNKRGDIIIIPNGTLLNEGFTKKNINKSKKK